MTNIRRIKTRWLVLAGLLCGLAQAVANVEASAADAEKYNETWLARFRSECLTPQKTDTSPQARVAYCDCWGDLMQKSVPWPDAQSFDLALRSKSYDTFNEKEKSIGVKMTGIVNHCKAQTGVEKNR